MVIKIYVIVCVAVLIHESPAKSLFDDLPLNGAYSAGVEEQPNGHQTSKHELSPPFSLSTTIEKRTLSKGSEESNSLFDTLPNQGAILDTVFDSKTQKRGIFASQSDLLRSPDGELRFQIELERPVPQFNTNQVPGHPGIVQNVVNPQFRPLVPIVPVVQANSLVPIPQQYGTPIIPEPVKTIPTDENLRNPERTLIVYGSHVPNSSGDTQPQVRNNLNPPYQATGNFYYPRDQQRTLGYRQSQRLPIPIITASSMRPNPNGYGPETGNQNIDITTSAPPTSTLRPTSIISSQPQPTPARPPSTGVDYDYETLEDVPKKEAFGDRTGIFKFDEPSESYNVPSEEAKSYYNNNNRQPAETYGPPPSYGPPTPSPSYGPPSRVPVLENVSPPAPLRPTSTTSISYQTIPIQTVQTQLVTVPQITVSSSSVSDSDTIGNFRPQAQGRPQASPMTSYGIPESPRRGGLASGIFTDEQIALLLGASRGPRGDSVYENEDTVSLLLGTGGRTAGNIFSGNLDLDPSGVGDFGILGRSRLRNQPILLNSAIQLPSAQFANNGGGLLQNQIQSALISQQFQQQRFRNADLSLLSGTRNSPVLTGDAVNAVDDIIRQERLRNAVAELRGRLRHEGHSSLRARQNYRSLLYKGALLLGALTLLPAVATPLAAAASGIHTPHFLLPLAAGRRKRSVEPDNMTPLFEICKNLVRHDQFSRTSMLIDYLNCVGNTTSSTGSLFDSLPFNGALIPEKIRLDLKKYVPINEIVNNSECLQKQACQTLMEIRGIPDAEAFSLLFDAFAKDIVANPWIRDAITAAEHAKCMYFNC